MGKINQEVLAYTEHNDYYAIMLFNPFSILHSCLASSSSSAASSRSCWIAWMWLFAFHWLRVASQLAGLAGEFSGRIVDGTRTVDEWEDGNRGGCLCK